jgi:hypothetical protein
VAGPPSACGAFRSAHFPARQDACLLQLVAHTCQAWSTRLNIDTTTRLHLSVGVRPRPTSSRTSATTVAYSYGQAKRIRSKVRPSVVSRRQVTPLIEVCSRHSWSRGSCRREDSHQCVVTTSTPTIRYCASDISRFGHSHCRVSSHDSAHSFSGMIHMCLLPLRYVVVLVRIG